MFTWARASSHTSRGASEHSAAQSRKLDRNPSRHRPDAELADHLGDRRIREPHGLALTGTPGPNRSTTLRASRSDRQRPRRQGNAVAPGSSSSARLGSAIPGHLKVHLVPPGAAHLTAPARGQYQELEGQHRGGIGSRLRAPSTIASRTSVYGSRRLMPGPDARLEKRCADGVSGVVVFPVAMRDRRAHDGGVALPHAAGGLLVLRPDGYTRTAITSAVPIRLTGISSESPHGVVPEARPPLLLRPAAVRPTRPVDRDHRVDGFPEGGTGPLPAGHYQIAPSAWPPGSRAHFSTGASANLTWGHVPSPNLAHASVHDDALRPGLGEVAA